MHVVHTHTFTQNSHAHKNKPSKSEPVHVNTLVIPGTESVALGSCIQKQPMQQVRRKDGGWVKAQEAQSLGTPVKN